MSNEKSTVRNVQGTMTAQKIVKSTDIQFGKNRYCTDCLYCKVCAIPLVNNRLCFCSKSKERERDIESNWSKKPVCKKFIDMSA